MNKNISKNTNIGKIPLNGVNRFLNKIFSIQIEEKKNYKTNVVKKYKVFRILFLKIKFNIAYLSNKLYKIDKNGNKRLVTNKKELFKYLNKVTGKNNVIIIPDTDLLSTNFLITGNNNTIELPWVEYCSNFSCSIFGNNNLVYIKTPIKDKSPYWSQEFSINLVIDKDNCELRIGSIISIVNVNFIFLDSNRKIIIGDDCLFSSCVKIWTTDGHPFYDLTTGERLNKDKDVIIGNKVWIGTGVFGHKGAVIPDGCIVGADSQVFGEFSEPNAILAGTPARIVKRNIRWEERDY